MPPKKVLSAYIFVFDLHIQNVEEARHVLYKILLKHAQDKAATKSQDVYKIILVGTSDTENVNSYKNIKILIEWSVFRQEEIIELMPTLNSTQIGPRGNLFEGIDLAVEHIQNDMLVTAYKPKNVIVISDLLFTTPNINKNSLRHALSETWLYVIGANVKTPKLRTINDIKKWSNNVEPAIDDINLKKNIKIIQEIQENGLIADLKIGWQIIFIYVAETKPPYPWYCDMTIGDIILKINVIKLVEESHLYKFPKSESSGVDYDEYTEQNTRSMINPETGEIVTNGVPAYKVKGRYAVLTEEQEKESAREENEDKCFELKYFVDAAIASPENFVKDQLHTVVADTRTSEAWQTPLKELQKAMFQQNVAAVIKRVYSKGPQFREMPYLLFNCQDHGTNCLLLAKLPFAHEVAWKEPTYQPKNRAEKSIDKSEMKSLFFKYLSDITEREDDNLDTVRECFLQYPNYSSQYNHLIKSLVEPNYNIYQREIPEYKMSENLNNRSLQSWKEVEALLPECEEEKS